MKRTTMPRLLRVSSVLAAIALTATVAPAQADIFSSAKKGLKKTTQTVSSGVTHTASTVATGTTKAANTVADGTTKTANTVADGVTGAANQVVSGTKSVLSADELKVVQATAAKSYTATVKAGETAYHTTVAAVKAGLTAAEQAALRAAAEAYLRQYKGFLTKLRSNIDVLAKDEGARVIVNRLVKAAAEKRLDDQTRADLQTIGERLGLLEWKPNSIVPGSAGGAMKSSWGLSVSAGAAYGAGAEGAVGLIANCYKEADQHYGAGLAVSVGLVAGASIGGAADVTFSWQPGGVDSAEGGYLGLVLEGSYAGIGGVVGLQWSLAQGMKGASAAIPGFYLGWSAGMKLSAAIDGGYTWVPVKSVK